MSANEWVLLDMFTNLKVACKKKDYPLIIDYGGGRPNDSAGKVEISMASVAVNFEVVDFRN